MKYYLPVLNPLSQNSAIRKSVDKEDSALTDAIPHKAHINQLLFIKKNFNNHWPLLALFITLSVIAFINYVPGTYLTGWDNLHPEFDFWLNIRRSIFAVWQEYQGLGLLGGMGHASDLIRQLFLLFLSSFIPNFLSRYVATYLCLLIGSVGAYYLTRSTLFKNENETNKKLFSFLAGLFYICNLATLQTFYAPFEAFIAHFAALPWLLLVSINFLIRPRRKTLLYFCLTLLLATPAAYIPTLFVVYMLSFTIIVTVLFFIRPSRFFLFHSIQSYLIIFLVNAFWLLPFLYFTTSSANVNVNSKINQMATETIFLQNKAYGDIINVALLKGFWFSNIDPDRNGKFTYMMGPWRDYVANPFVVLVGLCIFAVILIGIIAAIRTKNSLYLALCFLFIFAFTMLATATPPFSWFDVLFRKLLPLFNQAFRFPFTKFSLLAALLYSLFFSYGAYILTLTLKKHIQKTYPTFILPLFFIVMIFIMIAPIFTGTLFYDKERLIIPSEYFQLFDYLKKTDTNRRIANLPQPTFWGWTFYRWGYGGSGFTWYGIHQPILDRAFDVWSAPLENYYYELTQALYAKDAKAFENVINKYGISYLMLDRNVIYPFSPPTLLYEDTERLLAEIPSITKEAQFGNITLYHVDLKNTHNSYIALSQTLPRTNSYIWNDHDQALTLGNYSTSEHADVYYPFRSLFSNKTKNEIEYYVIDERDYITFETKLNPSLHMKYLFVPSLLDTQTTVPTEIRTIKEQNGDLTVTLTIYPPEIYFDSQRISGTPFTQSLVTIPANESYPVKLDINGVITFDIPASEGHIATTFLSLTGNNIFTVSRLRDGRTQPVLIEPTFFTRLAGITSSSLELTNVHAEKMRVRIRKVDDKKFGVSLTIEDFKHDKNCNQVRQGEATVTTSFQRVNLLARDTSACISYFLPDTLQSEGYVIFIKGEHIQGRDFQFWVLNESNRKASIDTYLTHEKDGTYNSTFVLTPSDPFGNGYSLHINSNSIGNEMTENILSSLSMYPIPYQYLKNLMFANLILQSNEFKTRNDMIVNHPNESLYIVENLNTSSDFTTLLLSQAYDIGWKAYKIKGKHGLAPFFPFFFGREIKTHIKVNNWMNGWELKHDSISKNDTIIIVYLPQYLEYGGFVLGIFVFAWIGGLYLQPFSKRYFVKRIK